jgi:type VI secretion system protein ImpB
VAGIHEKLDRVRKPRVHIKYEVETEGASVERELPFVVGVMGDFSGNPTAPKAPLKNRKFVKIDRDNFDKVMAQVAPELNIGVDNVLEEGGNKEMKVKLNFNSMDDFTPGRIAGQVPALKKLMDTRNKLRDLMAKVDRSEDLESLLEQVLQKKDELNKLSSDLGVSAEQEKK